MSIDNNISLLIARWLKDEISSADQERLDQWLDEKPEHRQWFDEFVAKEGFHDKVSRYFSYDVDRDWESLNRKHQARRLHISGHENKRFQWRKVLGYAAMVLPLVLCGLAWMLHKEDTERTGVFLATDSIGRRQAVLMTDLGEHLLLTGEQDSCISLNGSSTVQILHGGHISYRDVPAMATAKTEWHTLSIPQGAEYKVDLDDGTEVWLNAESSLHYPIRFSDKSREVYLTGEAYFHVSKMQDKPFIVHVKDLEVKVYGTSFNVCAVNPQHIKTTLVEGKVGVRIKSTGEELLLKPDEMAEYNNADRSLSVREVDTYLQVAWKYGEFVFCDERLEDIMDDFTKWYGIDVFYESESLKDKRFTGIISRFSDVRDALSMLEGTESVHFDTKKRTVVVKK